MNKFTEFKLEKVVTELVKAEGYEEGRFVK